MNKISNLCFRAVRATGYIVNQKISQYSQLLSKNILFSPNVRHVNNACVDMENPPLTPEEEKKLKILKLEYDVFQCTGVLVPNKMTEKEWTLLVRKHHTVHTRKGYYTFLFKSEKAAENKKKKALINVQAAEMKRAEIEKMRVAGLIENFQNRIMLLLLESTMNKYYFNNLFYGMANGAQRLVFDFSFEQKMADRERKDLIKQILNCHGINKELAEPYHFHFCNFSPDEDTHRKLNHLLNLDRAPISVSADSYLDHYPKERLVYLSPNARDFLTEYNHDDVYIIGSLVDTSSEVPLTFAKAKREGIRMAKLPLDRYVKWVQGTKALPLNHVMSILHKVKDSKGWQEAISESLPSRKFKSVDEEKKAMTMEEEDKKKKRKKHRSINFQ